MAISPIDVEILLQPLAAGSHGAGVDLRSDYSSDSIYQKLRDARSEARALERQRDKGDADGPADISVATYDNWRTVLTLGQQALATGSKDFEVASWLAEALVRIHGFDGLAAASRLIEGLSDAYWETGFPQPDDEGLESRAAPLGGLSGAGADGTIMQPLRMIPLFNTQNGMPVGYYLYTQSQAVAGLNEDSVPTSHAGAPKLTELQSAAKMDRAFLLQTGRAAADAREAWRKLDNALSLRFGADAPSMRKVTALLDQICDVIIELGGVDTAAAEVPAIEAASSESDAATANAPAGGTPSPAPGAIRTREDALRELNRIADFFRRTEPHSPLAYTLDEAVRRGRMTLAELLAEVLPNEETRNGMLSRLGMRQDGSG